MYYVKVSTRQSEGGGGGHVASMECMALGGNAFQHKQWTIIEAPRSPVRMTR